MSSLLHHPALAGCRRLFLVNYELPVRIGVHDFEKGSAQRLLFNVDLYVPLTQSTP
jgi:7,8-dihydroneopterin aldolase/epimerase/oxygenase